MKFIRYELDEKGWHRYFYMSYYTKDLFLKFFGLVILLLILIRVW